MVTDTLLTRSVTEAERVDFIKGVRSQTDKLDFLFQALVKTSRLETGVIRLEKKQGRIYDTVAQAMSLSLIHILNRLPCSGWGRASFSAQLKPVLSRLLGI